LPLRTNKVILIGNLGAAPQNPPHPGRAAGGKFALGDLGVLRDNATGERKEKT
jgi:hypothetical protein